MTKPTTRPRPDTYRQRFGLTHHPLPRDAAGSSFFCQTRALNQLEDGFQALLEEPGLGVLTAEAGVGKTAAMRNICSQLATPDFRVLYLCNTAASPFDIYRSLALELGLSPAHRKSQLWWALKAELVRLLDEAHTVPIIVLDEAQHLSDAFLADLSGFLNFAFDTRSAAALWLVGLPSLAQRLRLQVHAPLASRIAAQVQLAALERDDFKALIEHGLKAAGSREKLLTDAALELLFRASRGIPRIASRLLRASLKEAHARNQNLVDDAALKAAVETLALAEEVRS
ncbi:MAG: AAA family ATPase [Myxococcaceae bacterium]|jgi:type II secretory pathway predicted ATPase ExeA|nr:AAA family ATPase [Myxococcaceae bacterium]